MRAERITVAHLTPAMSRLLTQGSQGAAFVPSLRYAFFGGDALTRPDVAQIRALAPGAACVNFYGATETPQAVGFFEIDEEDEGSRVDRAIPIGRGIDGVQLLVVNRAGQLAGIGEPGEICVRSPYLARGYRDSPAPDGAPFAPSPFTGTADDRLYRTGDQGRYRVDGTVECQGRLDRQVKLRGFRIEPAEIEAALLTNDLIEECIVTLREDEAGERSLVAYVVGATEPPAPAELRSFLEATLPAHMIPSAFVAIDRLPLSPNGKVDHRRLPPPDSLSGSDRREYVAPGTPVEEALADIWRELLPIDRVGVHDGFFELGGHSLLATQLISRIREMFDLDLPLRRLFERPTVRGLALAITQMLIDAESDEDAQQLMEQVHRSSVIAAP
jgi:acyl-coenzyme A synthetase/AMP-(fatty) acid ligase